MFSLLINDYYFLRKVRKR